MRLARRAFLAVAGTVGVTGQVAGEDDTNPPGTLYSEGLYGDALYAADYTLDDPAETPDDSDDSEDTTEQDEYFIATAAEGSKSHPHVERLRDFRDVTLRGSRLGRLFIRLYYTTSPPVAQWIGRTERRRHAVSRLLVRPLARAVTAAQLYDQSDADTQHDNS